MKLYKILVKKYETGYSSEHAHNLYDFNDACKACNTGAKVISPHRLKDISKSFDKHLFRTYSCDFFISEQLCEHLKNMNIRTTDFIPTANQKGKRMPFYQLTSQRTFPPAKLYGGYVHYDDYCKVCGRDNFSRIAQIGYPAKNIPFKADDIKYVYKGIGEEFLDGRDVFNTWECLSRAIIDETGLPRVLPKPMLIVSERFKDALDSFGIDYADYWEVKFE